MPTVSKLSEILFFLVAVGAIIGCGSAASVRVTRNLSNESSPNAVAVNVNDNRSAPTIPSAVVRNGQSEVYIHNNIAEKEFAVVRQSAQTGLGAEQVCAEVLPSSTTNLQAGDSIDEFNVLIYLGSARVFEDVYRVNTLCYVIFPVAQNGSWGTGVPLVPTNVD